MKRYLKTQAAEIVQAAAIARTEAAAIPATSGGQHVQKSYISRRNPKPQEFVQLKHMHSGRYSQ